MKNTKTIDFVRGQLHITVRKLLSSMMWRRTAWHGYRHFQGTSCLHVCHCASPKHHILLYVGFRSKIRKSRVYLQLLLFLDRVDICGLSMKGTSELVLI